MPFPKNSKVSQIPSAKCMKAAVGSENNKNAYRVGIKPDAGRINYLVKKVVKIKLAYCNG